MLDCTDRITFVELEEGDRKRARPFDSEPQTLTCQQICGRRSDQVLIRYQPSSIASSTSYRPRDLLMIVLRISLLPPAILMTRALTNIFEMG